MPRILITRAPHQSSALAEGLRAHGFETILIPTIELTDPTTFAPLDAAIASLATNQVPQGFSPGSHSQRTREGAPAPAFHWLLFTSANAVEAFAKRLRILAPNNPQIHVILSEASWLHHDAQPKNPQPTLHPATLLELFSPFKIAAIGQATARATKELLGTEPTLVPPQAVAESLAEALVPHAKQPDGTPTRFLLLRAEQARDILPEALTKAGGEVTIAPVYRTVIPQDSITLIRTLFHSPVTYPDAITFTSSSTATNLLALLNQAGLNLPPDIQRISIGPITSQTLRDLHLPPHAEASQPTIPALIGCITLIFA